MRREHLDQLVRQEHKVRLVQAYLVRKGFKAHPDQLVLQENLVQQDLQDLLGHKALRAQLDLLAYRVSQAPLVLWDLLAPQVKLDPKAQLGHLADLQVPQARKAQLDHQGRLDRWVQLVCRVLLDLLAPLDSKASPDLSTPLMLPQSPIP